MKNKTLLRVVLVLTTVVWSTPAVCLEKPMHQAINQNLASRSIDGFSLNEYLMNVLGFEKGINEPLWGYHEETQTTIERPIIRWLGYGGITEDEPEGLIRYVTNLAGNNN